MLITETKAFVMQLPAALAASVEQVAVARGASISLVFEQALREWMGSQAGAADDQAMAWAAPLEAETEAAPA